MTKNLRITATCLRALKHLQSFKKIRLELKEQMRSQDTQCLYVLVEVGAKTD